MKTKYKYHLLEMDGSGVMDLWADERLLNYEGDVAEVGDRVWVELGFYGIWYRINEIIVVNEDGEVVG